MPRRGQRRGSNLPHWRRRWSGERHAKARLESEPAKQAPPTAPVGEQLLALQKEDDRQRAAELAEALGSATAFGVKSEALALSQAAPDVQSEVAAKVESAERGTDEAPPRKGRKVESHSEPTMGGGTPPGTPPLAAASPYPLGFEGATSPSSESAFEGATSPSPEVGPAPSQDVAAPFASSAAALPALAGATPPGSLSCLSIIRLA